ncbi:hypothetical protein NDI37_11805 [Funiculus sociatus GB2-A5]|uniref:Uncharacterized protein n=1 Tax=Funiculus sociatus GB2-A5 TaxID=2933946 RepID=A0ABV0JNW8_9CYAN|nr:MULTISPECIES: hypothetical protein [unclassified Trichocoleus]MBD1908211.1 hypothetical protein [Trichocoleus sp. FACHB-832]MBD2061779.1 hypothetical protein [Trichocoleus sp. FACHB-6]
MNNNLNSIGSNLTNEQRQQMATANIAVAFDYLDFLLENPEALEEIPDGATVILSTGDSWVDEQNNQIAVQVECAGETIHHVQELVRSA